jgi:hypothetical protein
VTTDRARQKRRRSSGGEEDRRPLLSTRLPVLVLPSFNGPASRRLCRFFASVPPSNRAACARRAGHGRGQASWLGGEREGEEEATALAVRLPEGEPPLPLAAWWAAGTGGGTFELFAAPDRELQMTAYPAVSQVQQHNLHPPPVAHFTSRSSLQLLPGARSSISPP